MADTRLLHGPYRAPRLKRGMRATCLYRDGDVIITYWSEARISWPRCMRPGERGGIGLLVNNELLRAIRNESASALVHWFGVGRSTLRRWRAAFGVTRTNNPATNHLYRVSAAKAGAIAKARTYSNRDRAKR